MSSTTIIACISSAIHDAELLVDDPDHGEVFEVLIICLRFLKTFVLCGQTLCKDASFQHFLVRIEEKLRKKAAKLHDFSEASNASPVAERFKQFTDSLLEEMDVWYVTMLDCSCTPHSTSLMTNEILEILTSVLEIIVNFTEEIDPLKVQMRFLMSLIHFVTKGSTEAGKDLLAQSETIAIRTAYVLFQGVCISSDENFEEMWSGVSTLVQKIKPIDPQVYEIYTQSLSGSKFPKQLVDDDALLAVKNFLDSLTSTLAEILWLDTRHMGSVKDQLQELFERLRSLKIILQQHPIADFDMDVQGEIADVVADAGMKICSLYQPQTDVNFGHQHLLDKFKIVLSKIADTGPQKPIYNSPRTSSYGFVDCILEKLMELKSSEAESTAKSHVQTIQVELSSITSSLREVVELRDEQVEVQTLWDRLLEVVFKVENAIDYQVVDPLSDSFSTSFDSIIEDIGTIKADVLKIKVKEGRSRTQSHLPSQTTSASNEVIGFQDEERTVLDRLRGGSQHLRIIAVVGMPGIGKTTLAKKVYNHSSLSYHFSAKAWCPISQVLDKKSVLLDLLKQICPNMSSEMSEHDLADQLRRSLKRRRYIIFLDDIWNTEAWNSLKDSFPNDTKGSRIIFTSRSLDVAPREMLDQEPLILSPLSEEDSLKLLCSKLFPGKGYVLPPALHDLGMQIVARCAGLPLAIVIVAGVLANVEAETWNGILDNFSFLSTEGNFRYTLEFSYRHLPDYLRPCFLYFGAFGEDQEVSVMRLLRLWIAEGFVRKSETNSLEDVADSYLNMLIGRSLIMAAKQRSDGGVKTCRIHDLLRDFCLEKANNEHFFHFSEGSDELYSFNELHNVRRLLIDSEGKAWRESNLYCPRAHSLLLRRQSKDFKQVNQGMSHMLQFLKLLKVLDLEQIDVGDVFPGAIQQLVLLSFLAIAGGELTIPPWLVNLSNLETLIISIRVGVLSLPDHLWNMRKLKYLYIKCLYFNSCCGVLPISNLDNSSILYELDRFTGAKINWCHMEKQLRKFPNIRKLKCTLVGNENVEEHADKFVFPEFSSKLESLHMDGGEYFEFGVRFEFASLTNLKKLKLVDICLYWEIFSVMGNQLPCLEVLKLDRLEFEDEEEYTWEMNEGEFSKLRILYLNGMPIRRWIACDDHEFECFQKLELSWCKNLVELPSCLESIETLEAIEVCDCSEEIEDLVKDIEVAQSDWGNSGLKITVRNNRV